MYPNTPTGHKTISEKMLKIGNLERFIDEKNQKVLVET